MQPADAKRISRFLSLVLRHHPERIGIRLDPSGWTTVDELLEAMEEHGKPVTRAVLEDVVRTNDKQRFVFSADGSRIRANQGHSIEVNLGYQAIVPPELLYHGTVDRFLASIRDQGLVKGGRHHVHLSADEGTAVKVGGRRGQPVLLTVRSGEMTREGHAFYRTPNGVWLTDTVPSRFIDFPA